MSRNPKISLISYQETKSPNHIQISQLHPPMKIHQPKIFIINPKSIKTNPSQNRILLNKILIVRLQEMK